MSAGCTGEGSWLIEETFATVLIANAIIWHRLTWNREIIRYQTSENKRKNRLDWYSAKTLTSSKHRRCGKARDLDKPCTQWHHAPSSRSNSQNPRESPDSYHTGIHREWRHIEQRRYHQNCETRSDFDADSRTCTCQKWRRHSSSVVAVGARQTWAEGSGWWKYHHLFWRDTSRFDNNETTIQITREHDVWPVCTAVVIPLEWYLGKDRFPNESDGVASRRDRAERGTLHWSKSRCRDSFPIPTSDE